MSIIHIFGVAVALAMDAFAVSVAVGINLKKVNFRQTFRLSWHFGLFQALMPVIGWGLGTNISGYIEDYDHWVAFGLLGLVGSKMLKDAIQPEKEDDSVNIQKDSTRGLTMVLLSIATSIDALAIGFSMSVLNISIFFPAVIIGVVAAVFTIVGLHLGKTVSSSKTLSVYAEIVGGIVLWGIGINVLYNHGVFSY